MYIGIYYKGKFEKEKGGGFAYLDQLFQYLFNSELKDRLALIVPESQDETYFNWLKDHFKIEKVIQIPNRYIKKKKRAKPFFSFLGKSTSKKIDLEHELSAFLREEKIGLIYYPMQHQFLTPSIPFILNNWDLAHITTSSFPDVEGNYEVRQQWYRDIMPRAIRIIAESETGKKELLDYCGIPEDKVVVSPMFPGSVINENPDNITQQKILNSFNLTPNSYFFYPANFWRIKNHYTLIEAFRIANFTDKKLVFSGVDKGNLDYIKQIVKDYNLNEKVQFIGFVSEPELATLYKNAIALTMPTYLGPTNMPILEAMALKCPVICSDHGGHKEMGQQTILYCDPSDSTQLANLMKRLATSPDYRKQKAEEAYHCFFNGENNVDNAMNILISELKKALHIRSAWK